MPRFIFLRHSKLDLPYPSYDQMPFAYLCALASRQVDPTIDKRFCRQTFTDLPLSSLSGESIKIWSSPASRCRDSADILREVLCERNVGCAQDVTVFPELDEVRFDLSHLYTPPVSGTDMTQVNRAVFQGMLDGIYVEGIDLVYRRAQVVLDGLTRENTTVICLTHDFFMRVIELLIRAPDLRVSSISAEMLKTTWRNAYCSGFACDAESRRLIQVS